MKLIVILFVLNIAGCLPFDFTKTEKDKVHRLKKAGKELLQLTPESKPYDPAKDIVRIGPSLFKIITSRKTPANSIKIKIEKGDFFNPNERKGVTHSLFYITDKSKLGLRMRYDSKIDKFHIVGYSGSIE